MISTFNLSTFYPKDNEYIIWKYDMGGLDVDSAAFIHTKLQEYFPNNQVISIPSNCSLESMDKEELKKILDNAGQN